MQHCPRVRRCLPPLLIQVGVVTGGRGVGGAVAGSAQRRRAFHAASRVSSRSVGLTTRRSLLILAWTSDFDRSLREFQLREISSGSDELTFSATACKAKGAGLLSETLPPHARSTSKFKTIYFFWIHNYL